MIVEGLAQGCPCRDPACCEEIQIALKELGTLEVHFAYRITLSDISPRCHGMVSWMSNISKKGVGVGTNSSWIAFGIEALDL